MRTLVSTARMAAAALTLLAECSCRWGAGVTVRRLATQPTGLTGVVERETSDEQRERGLVGPSYDVELLAVAGSGLIVLNSESHVVFVPQSVMRRFHPAVGGSNYALGRRGEDPAERRDRVRLVSRYPAGLSGALLQAVLAEYHQQAVEVLP